MKAKVNSVKGKLTEAIESILNEKKAVEHEYKSIVEDILDHEVFQQLQNFFHHNSSIYDHAKVVSYVSYKICKLLNLDYRSAARGGLLHDFFLYDWRNHNEPELAKEKYHGLEHPKIALDNSMKHFELNDIEKDIIVKHMWPLTFVPPKYQESFVVTFADKYVSSREFIDEFKKRQVGKIKGMKKKKAVKK
ncbi:MAG: HD family phosphohydrolase [Spirochaetae bacterium HGW-Spirochaetae-5]|nr:MAG: HD family phosphohydrolase [Spirochaetae bacterium HGW-Spirochaetae-5]